MMIQKLKTTFIYLTATLLFIWGLALYFSGTRGSQINSWWAVGLATFSIIYGVIGLFTAKRWSWLKSKVGQGVFFISLGVITWGIAQAGWAYFVLLSPEQETPPYRGVIDTMFFLTIPLWTYGIIRLSTATGAKFGLKTVVSKLLVLGLIIFISGVSYYFLVVVARGGIGYYSGVPFLRTFYDLSYVVGDAINLTLVIAIYGLSWKYLGGQFKRPIITILIGFVVVYFADFMFSYRDGQGVYYNGDIADLLFLVTMAIFGIAISMLDPATLIKSGINNNQASATSLINPQTATPTSTDAITNISPTENPTQQPAISNPPNLNLAPPQAVQNSAPINQIVQATGTNLSEPAAPSLTPAQPDLSINTPSVEQQTPQSVINQQTIPVSEFTNPGEPTTT